MAYEDPNAPPSPTSAPATVEANTPDKKSGSWDWLWPSIMAAIIFKLFGLAGGMVSLGCYYWLKPKLGAWGAITASGIIGIIVAIGFVAMTRN